MKPVIFIILPVTIALAIVYILASVATNKTQKAPLYLAFLSIFLYLSSVVSNVVAPRFNELLKGEFHNDIGIVGFTERTVITFVLYGLIVSALFKWINFKNVAAAFLFIATSSLLYSLFFDLFLNYF